MKKMSVLLSISLLAVILCGFCWSHNWIPATCTEPESCSKCGKTQADALGHTWENRKCATCGMEKEILHSGDWDYILWEETGTVELTRFLGTSADVVIPEQLEGVPVTAIGTLCFLNSRLETVEIPSGITAIGDFAFGECPALASVTIPDTIISIGKNPFLGSCPEFHVSVTNPAVAVIDGVLFDKTEKRLISYPCQSQREQYDIPQGILEIGDSAFLDARYLQVITIPDSVTTVGRNPFCLCPAELSVSASHPALAVVDGVLFDKTSKTLLAYPYESKAASYEVPEGIESIGDSAFLGVSSLQSIFVPHSVKSIGLTSFRGFFGEIVLSENHSNFVIINGVLFEKGNHRLIHYPPYLIAGAYEVPTGIKRIDAFAFADAVNLHSINVPDSVTDIGYAAFEEIHITTKMNTFASQYCIENGIAVTYSDALDWLNEPEPAQASADCSQSHNWVDASCTSPKICTACWVTEGTALGHAWIAASCASPSVCAVCNLKQGEPLGHSWIEATYTAPQTCSVCGETVGEKLQPINPTCAAIPCEELHLLAGVDTLTFPGQYWKLLVKVVPENTTDRILYTSENENVVTVDEYGRLTAIGAGTTNIVISCGDKRISLPIVVDFDSNEAETSVVEVPLTPTDGFSELKLKKTDVTFSCRGVYLTLELENGIAADEVKWSSSDPSVATVYNGNVTALGKGVCVIRAEYNGQVAECVVRCNF